MEITRLPTVKDVENGFISLGWKRREIAARLSEKIGIDETTWRRWRNKETEPTLSAFAPVVDYLIKLQQREKQNGKKMRLGRGRNGKAARTRV